MRPIALDVIPHELLETIVDLLRDDLSTLKQCSLVSRRFLHLTRSHIFANLSLTPFNFPRLESPLEPPQRSPSLCRRFYELLLSSPHIGSYVRNLTIIEGHLFQQRTTRSGSSGLGKGLPWIAGEYSLPPVIEMSTELSSLSLHFQDGPLRIWSGISELLQEALLHALRLPTLIRVEMQNVSFRNPEELCSLFEGCVALKHISLLSKQGTDIIPFSPGRTYKICHIPTGVRAQIESLAISTLERDHPPLMEWLLGPHSTLDLTNLKSLSLPATGILELSSTVNVLEHVGGSLERLSLADNLCLPSGTKSFTLDVDIGPLLRLKSLHLGIEVFYADIDTEDSTVLWLVRLLSSIGHCNAIEEISITLFMEKHLDFRINEWRAIDDMLSEPKMRYLQSVTLRVITTFQFSDELHTLLKTALSCTLARKLLAIQFIS